MKKPLSNTAFLGIDLGGTGVKAGVFDRDGRALGFGHCRLNVRRLPHGHAEIPIQEVYAAARAAVRQALAERSPRILALSVSSQGQTFVALDDRGKPLAPAILWYDSRAAGQAAELRRRLARRRGCSRLLPEVNDICSAAKILWLKEHVPAVARRAAAFYLLPEYIAWRLAGRAVTDPCTASSTGLCVSGVPEWSAPALAAAGLTAEQLAEIRETGAPVGTVTPRVAAEWGLSPETLVVTGTNDQYAGAIGCGNCREGIVSEMSGTCLAMVTLCKTLPRGLPPGLFTGHFPIAPYRFVLAFAKTAGLTLDWFRREFAPGMSFRDLDRGAARVRPGGDGLTAIPHFDGRVSPSIDPAVRGRFAGLGLHHGREHLYRALLESLTFVMRENLEAMAKCGLRPRIIRAIGGGAVSDLWLQMKADVTGLRVERPVVTEAPVLGAAIIAATGYGAFPSVAACSHRFYRAGKLFRPRASFQRAYRSAYARFMGWSRQEE
jgi:xylulokinase